MTSTASPSPIRVGQWATGAVGREALRSVLTAPGLDLVAVLVTDPAKVGADASTLADLPAGSGAGGVTATADVDEFLAARPEVVVYAPRVPDVAAMCRILGAGMDVVTSATAFHPERMAPADRDALRAACETGGSTLHGSGINPGNFGIVIPLALSGLVRDLRHASVSERADWSVYESTRITFDTIRFGHPPEEVSEERAEGLAVMADLFRQQVWALGDALGADLDRVDTRHEVAVAAADHPVFDRVLESCTVNAQRWRFAGMRGEEELVVVDCQWTVGPADVDWPPVEHGWTVRLEGDPSLQAHLLSMASLTEPRSMEEHVRAASVATAAQVVNAIPHVRAAAPGFATSADLPLVSSLGGFRAGR